MTSLLRKRSGRSPERSGFSEIEARPPKDHYLETAILRGIKEDGKFVDTQFCAEKVA